MPRVYQSTKDFTEEEKAVILTRLKTQKAVDIAKDLGTSWQVIVALQNASRNDGDEVLGKVGAWTGLASQILLAISQILEIHRIKKEGNE